MGTYDSLLKDTGEIKIGSFTAPIYSVSELSLENSKLGNSFGLKYKLYGAIDYDAITEIITGNVRDIDMETSISPRVVALSDYNTEVELKYFNKSDVNTEVQPKINIDCNTEIFINPSNRMWALYEVQQPPIITDVFNPTKDSFTRSQTNYQTINYGDSLSMVVGRTPDDILRSFVQFDTSSIDSNFVLTDSYMRLYYKDSPPNNLKFEVLTAGESWSEYGITDLNRPTPKNLVSNEYTINKEFGYIEFNVSDIVKDWVAKRAINDGLIIRLSNEASFGQTTFNTRETSKPPELIVNYYDSTIFSTGRSQVVTEIYAIQKTESDINTEITIEAVHGFSDYNTEIRVHIRDVPFDDDWIFEITSSRDKAHTEITASVFREEEIWTIIDARNYFEQEYETSIIANKDKVLTEITSAVVATSKFNTEITVTNDFISTEITARKNEVSQHDTEVTAHRGIVYNKHNFEILANRPSVITEITARVKDDSNPYTVIDVSKPSVETVITVKNRQEKDTEITVNSTSKKDTEILISRPQVYTEITAIVSKNSDILTEIQIPNRSDFDTEITAHVFTQYDTEITILLSSQHDTEIVSTRPSLDTEIMVPYYATGSRDTEITPRIRLVNNVNTVIQVGRKKGAYVFMM